MQSLSFAAKSLAQISGWTAVLTEGSQPSKGAGRRFPRHKTEEMKTEEEWLLHICHFVTICLSLSQIQRGLYRHILWYRRILSGYNFCWECRWNWLILHVRTISGHETSSLRLCAQSCLTSGSWTETGVIEIEIGWGIPEMQSTALKPWSYSNASKLPLVCEL